MFDDSTSPAVTDPSSSTPEGPSNDTTTPGVAVPTVDAQAASTAGEDPERLAQLNGLLARVNHHLAAVDLADVVAEARRVHEDMYGVIREGNPGQGNAAPCAQFLKLMRSRCDLGRRKVEMLLNVSKLAPEAKRLMKTGPLRGATKELEKLSKLDQERQLAVAKEHGSRTAFMHKLAEVTGTRVAPKPSASLISIVIPVGGQSEPVTFPSGRRTAAIRSISTTEIVVDLVPTSNRGVRAAPAHNTDVAEEPPTTDSERPGTEPLERATDAAGAAIPIPSTPPTRLGPDWASIEGVREHALTEDAEAVFMGDVGDDDETPYTEIQLGKDAHEIVHGALHPLEGLVKKRKDRKRINEIAAAFPLLSVEPTSALPPGTTVVAALGNKRNGVFYIGYGVAGPNGEAPEKLVVTCTTLVGNAVAVWVPLTPPRKDVHPLAMWVLGNGDLSQL